MDNDGKFEMDEGTGRISREREIAKKIKNRLILL
jgi:hypothetical protein